VKNSIELEIQIQVGFSANSSFKSFLKLSFYLHKSKNFVIFLNLEFKYFLDELRGSGFSIYDLLV
jgi:hypothetical protein